MSSYYDPNHNIDFQFFATYDEFFNDEISNSRSKSNSRSSQETVDDSYNSKERISNESKSSNKDGGEKGNVDVPKTKEMKNKKDDVSKTKEMKNNKEEEILDEIDYDNYNNEEETGYFIKNKNTESPQEDEIDYDKYNIPTTIISDESSNEDENEKKK